MNRHIGKKFDDFLEEEHILDVVEASAIKRILAYQIQRELDAQHLSKSTLAKKMQTSRSVLNRLLNPTDTAVTLQTLVKVANALGKKLQLSLV